MARAVHSRAGGIRTRRVHVLILAFVTFAALAVAAAPVAPPGEAAAVEVAPLSGAPRGVHVSFGDDARTTATVTWFTDGLVETASVVEHGATEALGSVATGTSKPAPGVAALVHEVALADLAPGALVHYRVGDGAEWSPVRAFRTDDGDGHARIAVWGDHGIKAQSAALVAQVAATSPDLAIIAGDLGYANGNQPVWDAWFAQNEPLFATVPFMPAIGNHEDEPPQGTLTFRERFSLPDAELYYSYDFARVHFLVLQSDFDSAAVEGILDDMLLFAEQDLSDAAARRAAGEIDFLVVVQHHPLFANTKSGEVPLLERQAYPQGISWEEQLLQRHQVDVLLAAHNHNYERSKPMIAAQPTDARLTGYKDPLGYVQVVTGGGGQSLYEFVDPNDYKSFVAKTARRFHYVQLDLEPGKITARAISTLAEDEGLVLDTWTLAR